MRRTIRLSPNRACKLASQCFGLWAVLASLSAARADEPITYPSQRDAAQSARLDTLFLTRLTETALTTPDFTYSARLTDSHSTRLTDMDSIAPGFPYYRDRWTTDGALGQSEHLFDGSESGSREREVTLDIAPLGYHDAALRGGWWTVARQGSPTKVGEYQGLQSSPFWDLDLLRSDGEYTLDLFGTGLDNESTQAGLHYFTPAHTANLRYQRFLHRLDHDPLTNLPPPGSGAEIIAEDFNVGDDYAVRLQDIRADYSGKLTENVKYHLDVWFRRKMGERQALGTHHGWPSDRIFCRKCHVESQRQEIDWMSTRVEPAIEARIGPITAEYSRPMRTFGQNDSVVTRSYGTVHPYDNYAVDYPYAVVPETMSQTDRLKLRSELPLQTLFYSQLYQGDTRNLQRDTRRRFYGFDIRLSNNYFSRVTFDGFVRYNRQLNQQPPFLVVPEGIAVSVPTAIVPPYGLRHPVDYLRTSTGVDVTWRPFRTSGLADRLTFNGGTELGLLDRSYADIPGSEPTRVPRSGPHLARDPFRGNLDALAPAIRHATAI